MGTVGDKVGRRQQVSGKALPSTGFGCPRGGDRVLRRGRIGFGNTEKLRFQPLPRYFQKPQTHKFIIFAKWLLLL